MRPRTAQERLIGRNLNVHLMAAIAEVRSGLPAIIGEAESGIALD